LTRRDLASFLNQLTQKDSKALARKYTMGARSSRGLPMANGSSVPAWAAADSFAPSSQAQI